MMLLNVLCLVVLATATLYVGVKGDDQNLLIDDGLENVKSINKDAASGSLTLRDQSTYSNGTLPKIQIRMHTYPYKRNKQSKNNNANNHGNTHGSTSLDHHSHRSRNTLSLVNNGISHKHKNHHKSPQSSTHARRRISSYKDKGGKYHKAQHKAHASSMKRTDTDSRFGHQKQYGSSRHQSYHNDVISAKSSLRKIHKQRPHLKALQHSEKPRYGVNLVRKRMKQSRNEVDTHIEADDGGDSLSGFKLRPPFGAQFFNFNAQPITTTKATTATPTTTPATSAKSTFFSDDEDYMFISGSGDEELTEAPLVETTSKPSKPMTTTSTVRRTTPTTRSTTTTTEKRTTTRRLTSPTRTTRRYFTFRPIRTYRPYPLTRSPQTVRPVWSYRPKPTTNRPRMTTHSRRTNRPVQWTSHQRRTYRPYYQISPKTNRPLITTRTQRPYRPRQPYVPRPRQDKVDRNRNRNSKNDISSNDRGIVDREEEKEEEEKEEGEHNSHRHLRSPSLVTMLNRLSATYSTCDTCMASSRGRTSCGFHVERIQQLQHQFNLIVNMLNNGCSMSSPGQCCHRTDDLEDIIKSVSDVMKFWRHVLHKQCSKCPVDCRMGSWSPWSECPFNCDQRDTQFRTRMMTQGKYGGKTCPDLTSETRSCPVHNTVRSQWSQWGSWSGCSSRCGGFRRRTRTCRSPESACVQPCQGDNVQVEECSTGKDCCVNAVWDNWSPWGTCSRDVDGKHFRLRTRICQPLEDGRAVCPNQCAGTSIEKAPCQSCTPSAYGEWSAWGDCASRTKRSRWRRPDKNVLPDSETDADGRACGQGTRSRFRNCILGNCSQDLCSGPSTDHVSCLLSPCCVVAEWSSWTTWSECQGTGRLGIQSRYRHCQVSEEINRQTTTQAGLTLCVQTGCGAQKPEMQSRACEDACPIPCGDPLWVEWSSWSSCQMDAQGGTGSRYRTAGRCHNPSQHLIHCQSSTCPGDGRDTESCCMGQKCEPAFWSVWSEWTSCENQAESRTRQRHCLRSAQHSCPQTQCDGHSVETDSCGCEEFCEGREDGFYPSRCSTGCRYYIKCCKGQQRGGVGLCPENHGFNFHCQACTRQAHPDSLRLDHSLLEAVTLVRNDRQCLYVRPIDPMPCPTDPKDLCSEDCSAKRDGFYPSLCFPGCRSYYKCCNGKVTAGTQGQCRRPFFYNAMCQCCSSRRPDSCSPSGYDSHRGPYFTSVADRRCKRLCEDYYS